jgi:hypothetical protein
MKFPELRLPAQPFIREAMGNKSQNPGWSCSRSRYWLGINSFREDLA